MPTKLKMVALIILAAMQSSCSQTPPQEGIKNGKAIAFGRQSYQTLEGFIRVPEDDQNPKSKHLLIPFFVVKSPDKHPEAPIFWLDGGPGGSNILSAEKIAQSNPETILAHHDFVCVGYRGVDGSVSLKSSAVNKALKGLNHQMLSEASLQNMENKVRTYHNELKNSGINIDKYTIMQVIADIEYARKFLGYSKINLLSSSYGTRVALLYGYQHPEVIQRSLMIGACPPGYFLPRAEFAEHAIQQYDSLYRLQKEAPYKGSISQAMQTAFKNLPRRWSVFKLDADKIKAGTTAALYNRGFAIMAFDAYFKAAYERDYSGLFLLQKIQDMSNIAAIGDVFAKTISADKNTMAQPEYTQTDSTILGKNMALIYERAAKCWPIESIPAAYTQSRNSAVPTVVISGDLDFRTPYYVTEKALMPYLSNGKHLILKNMSHLDILMNVMKSPEFIQRYFDSGTVESSLIKTVDKIDFKPKSSISKAKIFVIGVVK